MKGKYRLIVAAIVILLFVVFRVSDRPDDPSAPVGPAAAAGASPPATAEPGWTADEQAVIDVVERFLEAAGSYDLEAMPMLFTADASIGYASLNDGEWTAGSTSFAAWHASVGARENPSPYTEPVSDWTVHVDNGRLAFVRADATLHRDGIPRSRNMDYFMLLKQDGVWRILSGAYTAVPVGRG